MALRVGTILRVLGRLLAIPVAAAAGFALASLIAPRDPFKVTALEPDGEPASRAAPESIPALRAGRELAGVVQRENGMPVSRAHVRVTAGHLALEAEADEQGRFSFANLPDAPCTVIALAPGFRPAALHAVAAGTRDALLKLSPIEGFGVDRSLAPQGTGSLAATIAMADLTAGRPPRATVVAAPDRSDGRSPSVLSRSSSVDDPANPTVKIRDLPPGRYRVYVVPLGAAFDPRLAWAEKLVEVAAERETPITLELRWATLRGTVTSRGAPLERALVRALRTAGPPADAYAVEMQEVEIGRAVSGADGTFVLPQLPLGAMRLEILCSGQRPWARDVRVEDPATPVTAELEPEK